ncbi:MAG: TetR/AcrR family transcriptional regulator [Nostocoides sp.]
MSSTQTHAAPAPDKKATLRSAASGKSQRRRQELIDVAAKIFQDKGYEAASIQDVADALGILKGSVYYYINSKEDLLFAVVEEVHQSGLTNIDLLRQMDLDTLTLIRLFIQSHIRHITDNLMKVTVFFHDFGSLDPQRRAYIVEERDSYDDLLRSLIVRGQSEGVICESIDPKIATLGILGMMNWTYQWYREDGRLDAAAVGEQFAEMALAALACDEERHRARHRRQLGEFPADLTLGQDGRITAKNATNTEKGTG